MKIENLETSIIQDGKPLRYSDLLSVCANYVSPGTGVGIAEQRIRFKIIDACEAADGEIDIDAAHLGLVKSLVAKVNFGIIHRDFDSFGSFFENLK